MAIHWRCRFKSIDDTLYSVNIYDATYTGTPVELTGAAAPFETQEDGDEDMLAPVRVSTGALRLINLDSIDALIPMTPKARPVTLTHTEGNTTVVDWQGYIQQAQFTQQWTVIPYEIELPVVSALGILGGVQIVKDELPARNRMAEYFVSALAATGHSFDSIVFPAELGMTDSGPWDAFWRVGVQDRNWFSYNSQNVLYPDETRYDGASWLDIVSSIMKSFGYTLYERGRKLYIISRTTTNYLEMPASELQTLADNEDPATTTATAQTVNISQEQLAGASGTIDVIASRRKAIVEADVKLYDEDALPQVDMKYMDYAATLQVQKQISDSTGAYYFNEELGVYEPKTGTNIWTLLEYSDGNEVPWVGQDITIDAHIGALCRRRNGENVIFINYNSVGNQAHGWGGDGLVSVKSASESHFAGGSFMLCCSIELFQGTGAALEETYSAKFMLRVGTKYYNTTTNSWQTTPCTFSAKLDDSGRPTPVSSANALNGDGKFYIPLPQEGIFGDVELTFYDPYSSAATQQEFQAVFIFTNVSLDYVWPNESPYIDYASDDTNRFCEVMNVFALNDADKNIGLTSYVRNRMGYSVLLKPDFSGPITKMEHRSLGNIYFEQQLLEAIDNCYHQPQRVLTIPLMRDGQYSPLDSYAYNGGTYQYLSSNTLWRDSLHRIRIFKTQ